MKITVFRIFPTDPASPTAVAQYHNCFMFCDEEGSMITVKSNDTTMTVGLFKAEFFYATAEKE